MITLDQATVTLRALIPPSKKVFYSVSGDALADGSAIWLFRYFVPKESELVLVTPLISTILGYRTTDIEFLRVRGTQKLEESTSVIQNMLARALPQDGLLLCEISAGNEIAEVNLLGGGIAVPAVPALEIIDDDGFDQPGDPRV